ncbi:MAG TPA: diguanylate cyclase [Thermoanaerobaculia bacterium]|nr:diguanylate cyclase [Thermoanaerobaculia bacterium]
MATALTPPLPGPPVPAGLGLDAAVGTIVQETVTIEAGSVLAEDLDRRFKADRELEGLVVVAGGIPTHLVTREHYYAKTGGPYGFTFYQKKPAEAVGKASPLVVTEATQILSLARLALARPREDQYDPLIVTDALGHCRGIVTIRQLILKAAELEVRTAQLSNPLTHLPGTALIQTWIEHGLAYDTDGELTVLFTDLDSFKEYNDVYGLLQGDELVRATARVLSESLPLLGPEARLGHAGGDDFVLVSPQAVSTEALREICARFDREKLDLFHPGDLARGFFQARDDKGNLVKVPLNTLALAVVPSRTLGAERHPAVFSQAAASLRRAAKTVTSALGRSGFVTHGWREEAA